MKKLLLISILLSATVFCNAQTLICWRAELCKYNASTGEFDPTPFKVDVISEAFFNDKWIRINDYQIQLTKVSTRSRDVSGDGIVTVYDVLDENNTEMVATVVEDSQGIFKMLLTTDKSDAATAYYIKNR
ncbi:MAG: hypothetical protein V4556_00735 [Bacteroidota bacterium]